MPRPPGPTNPTACESSTRTRASYRSARSQIRSSGREVAVHREDAVGDDHPGAGPGRRDQLRLQVGHVGVPVAVAGRLGEAHPVDDRRVVEGVGDDRVLRAEEGLEDAAVRVEAGGEQDGVLGAEERRELRLQRLVQGLGPADEPDAGHPEAPPGERVGRRGDHPRVVGEPEVVVGAEVQRVGARLGRRARRDPDVRRLRRLELALALGQAGVLDLLERGAQPLLHLGVGGRRGRGGHESLQSRITLPHSPDRTAANAASKSAAGKRCVMTDRTASRRAADVCSIADMAYQVSYISRP